MAQLSTTMSQAHRATAFHYHFIVRDREDLACLRKAVARLGLRSIHLLDLESLLVVIFGIDLGTLALGGSNGVARGIRHVHVGHSDSLYGIPLQRRFGCGGDEVAVEAIESRTGIMC